MSRWVRSGISEVKPRTWVPVLDWRPAITVPVVFSLAPTARQDLAFIEAHGVAVAGDERGCLGDGEDIRAEAVDFSGHVAVGAVDQRNHSDHRRNADDHAQKGEDRAEFIGPK